MADQRGADTLNAFVPDLEVRVAGRAGGPLDGLTFAAKDLFDVAGYPTGGGNPDWGRQHPIPTRHAWAVQTLLDAGATLIGKTITDETLAKVSASRANQPVVSEVGAWGSMPVRSRRPCVGLMP